MKYAFMSFSTPKLTLKEMLTLARELGYDGIEPRLDAGHAHGLEVAATAQERSRIKRQAAESGIALACLATSLKYADPSGTEKMLQDTRERIDLAGDVGAPAVRVFGGGIPKGTSREDAIGLLVKSLTAVADHAAERRVTLCLETHDDWCDPAHVAAVVGRVNHPAVGVNWDIMHPVRAGKATVEESFETLRPWIRHLHVHDGDKKENKMVPMGEGDIDHRRAIALLMTSDYAGYLSGEWIDWEPWEIHLPREIAVLKGYEREVRG